MWCRKPSVRQRFGPVAVGLEPRRRRLQQPTDLGGKDDLATGMRREAPADAVSARPWPYRGATSALLMPLLNAAPIVATASASEDAR